MTQSASPMMPEHNPMKKKVVIALTAVIVGHLSVMWALSHIKTLEIKPNETKPMSVRFVTIADEPVIEPVVEPVVQPPKPEPNPEPIVKPKVIAQKQQVTEKKVQPQEEVVDKKKLEKERLDKLKQQQEQQDQQKRLEQQQRDQQQREQAERDRLANEQRENQRRQQELNTPKKLNIGQISWSRSPKPVYTNKDLQGSNRIIVVSIEADAKGSITNVRVIKSSGLSALDEKIVRAVKGAKFKPYKENGIAYPFKADQPFELTLNSNG